LKWNEKIVLLKEIMKIDFIDLFKGTVSRKVSNLHKLKKKAFEIGLYVDIKYSGKKPFCIYTKSYFEGLGLEIKETTDLYSEIKISGRGDITQDSDDSYNAKIIFNINKDKISDDVLEKLLNYRHSMDIWGTVEQDFFLLNDWDSRIFSDVWKNCINPKTGIDKIIGQILSVSKNIIKSEDQYSYSINNSMIYDIEGGLILMDRKDRTELLAYGGYFV